MPATLSVRDESASGQTLHQLSLDFLTERITVRELIRSRVYQEVQDHNLAQSDTFRGLVQPDGSERICNQFKLPKARTIDWKRQFEKAVAAFEKNQVLIMVADRQVESLDEEIELKPGTEATFLQLVPLVGG